ncbi:MAG: hypothetical protein M3T56_09590 [Chloroflexota bacterium]|nr:hypothetical protein [Chloroflexota bacterium]
MVLDPEIVMAIRIGLGAVLVLSALAKLRQVSIFRDQVAAYRLVPRTLLPYVSLLIISLELTSGTALLVGVQVALMGALAGALLLVFTVAALLALVRGLRIPCGCLGDASGDVGPGLITRNVALLAAASFLVTGGSLPQPTMTLENAIGVIGTSGLLVVLAFAGSTVDRLFWWSRDARRGRPTARPQRGSL